MQKPTKSGSFTVKAAIAAAVAVMGSAGIASADTAYKDITPAKNIQGRSVTDFVSSECGGCHNPKLTGATGPNITMDRLRNGLKGAAAKKAAPYIYPFPEESVYATIKGGRSGTAMPAWGTASNPIGKPLTEGEMKAIAQHVYNVPPPKDFHWTMEDMMKTWQDVKASENGKVTPAKNVDDLLFVTERENFSVAVIDTTKQAVVAHLPAGARAHGYTFSPDGKYAYNLGRDGWLYQYDLKTLQAIKKVRLGLDARGIAVSDNGKYLLTGMYIPTQAVIVDAITLKPIKIIDTHHVKDPDGDYVDSRICSVNDVDPKKVGPYFLMALKEGGQVWRIDWSKPDFPVTKVANVGKILHDGFLREDNKTFYLASQSSNWVAAIDVASMKILKKIPTGKKPHPGEGAVWVEDGVEYAATPHIGAGKVTVWRTDTNEIVGTVKTEAPGLFIRAAENMKYVWADSIFPPKPNEITVFERKPPFKAVKHIMDGTLTVHPEPDTAGKFVYVSDWKENKVRVYDDETLKLVKTIEGIKTPTGIFAVHRRHETGGH
ncbi:cytochrome D1 domain-containing protein [Thiolapillus sp.]